MTTTVDMQRDRVLLSEDKELQVREDGVFIRSLPDKNILLSYNRYCSYNICLYVHCVNLRWIIFGYVLCFSWVYVRSYLHKIDVEARGLNKKSRPVNYCVHIGHGIYVSVTDGICASIWCISTCPTACQKTTRDRQNAKSHCDWTNGRHSSTCCRSYMQQIHSWLTRNRVVRTVTMQTNSACSTVAHAIRFFVWLSRKKQLRRWQFDVVVCVIVCDRMLM